MSCILTLPPEWHAEVDRWHACLAQLPAHASQERSVLHQRLYFLYKQRGDYSAALAQAQQAVQCAPERFQTWGNLANIQRDLQQFTQAERSYQAAFQRCSDTLSQARLRFNWALCQLTQGNYTQGWQGFLAKFAGGHERLAPESLRALPRWQGESLRGKRILIQALEGFGDCLQWLRFLPQVRQATACTAVGFCSHPELSPLLLPPEAVAYSPFSQVTVYADGEIALKQQAFDVWLPLYALPYLCHAQMEHLPLPWTRLFPSAPALPESDAATWRVGLAWQANAAAPTARRRSIGLFEALPLLQRLQCQYPRIQFYAFQPVLSAAESEALEQVMKQVPLKDLGPHLQHFAHTAGYLQQMDALISVDTVMAHLAPALRVPTGLLLSYVADWRWLTSYHQESPWYPAEHSAFALFRQKTPGDWDSTFAPLIQEINRWHGNP